MESNFEERAYYAACMIMGEAVWQLVAAGEPVTQETIARMVVALSERRDDLAASIALSVLRQESSSTA
ncbi:hypothetical protein UF13_15265 [Pantoea agglomerans]|uniref:hypothetical protein n=1 Tax=Enterobacter agglomerans TaxID=549 RepID=UPI0005DEA284|nr:hypothetical protein [Pantoea agglomerans]KJH59147.1 hypothetical protein UF13_15265 [Pantoea agglomerans]